MLSIRRAGAASLGCALGLFLTAPAVAAPILDARYHDVPSYTLAVMEEWPLAQTFTVINTGALTGVSLQLRGSEWMSAPLTLEIRRTAGGLPGGGNDILASASARMSLAADAISVDFDVPDIAVTAGEVLALLLRTAADSIYGWTANVGWAQAGSPAGTYAGGQGYMSVAAGQLAPLSICNGTCNTPSQVDFHFTTFVEPAASPTPASEPMSLAMFGVGLLGIGLARAARRR